MTTEEKAKAYDESLEMAKKELKTCGSLDCDAARQIFRLFPQLAESEDERIRKGLIEALKASKTVGELKFIFPEPTREECIAYLEKQKEPVVNKEGLYYYLGGKFVYCGYPATEENPYDFAMSQQEKQKEQDNEEGDFTIYHPQKNGEGKYECIPFSFYGSLTSFSNDKDLMDFLNECFYDKEECERWCEIENKPKLPECKHKIKKDSYIDYLCESSGEEKQKEQKPRWEINNPHTTEWTKEMIDEKFKELVEEYHKQKPVEPSCDELQRHQDDLHDFKVFAAKQAREHHISFVHDFEWNNFCEELLSYFNEKQKPVDYEAELKKCKDNPLYFYDKYVSIKQKPAEWSEEDEKMLKSIIEEFEAAIPYIASQLEKTTFEGKITWLKSLSPQPHWKPSEEQMESLRRAVDKLAKIDVVTSVSLSIMYDNLKKLM